MILEAALNGPRTKDDHPAVPITAAELRDDATACERAGDRERALNFLERAVAGGWLDAAWLESDPELRAMREEPRFQQLVTELRGRSFRACC